MISSILILKSIHFLSFRSETRILAWNKLLSRVCMCLDLFKLWLNAFFCWTVKPQNTSQIFPLIGYMQLSLSFLDYSTDSNFAVFEHISLSIFNTDEVFQLLYQSPLDIGTAHTTFYWRFWRAGKNPTPFFAKADKSPLQRYGGKNPRFFENIFRLY